MATVVDSGGTLNFSQACANQADEISLLSDTGTILSSETVFSWGTASGTTGIDLASSVEFTMGSGDVVAKVALEKGGFILATADFSTTYSFPNGGVFELTSLNVLVD